MNDRLVWLLERFELSARVFQAGPMCHSAQYDAQEGLGYIHVLREGVFRLETSGRAPTLIDRPSLVFYMNPIGHSVLPEGPDPLMVCASFEFGAGVRNPLVQALKEVVVIELGDMPALSATLDIVFREAQETHCGRQAVLDRLIEVVIVQLLRELMEQNRLRFGLLAGLSDPKLMKAINAMHADPSRSWALEELAREAGMSRARFAARFRATVGLTPGAYLGEWRIGVAQSLLQRGNSVQLAADAVGYGSASALSRAFAAHVGLSPTEWLQRGEKGDPGVRK